LPQALNNIARKGFSKFLKVSMLVLLRSSDQFAALKQIIVDEKP
jgi:hypothetical protein